MRVCVPVCVGVTECVPLCACVCVFLLPGVFLRHSSTFKHPSSTETQYKKQTRQEIRAVLKLSTGESSDCAQLLVKRKSGIAVHCRLSACVKAILWDSHIHCGVTAV